MHKWLEYDKKNDLICFLNDKFVQFDADKCYQKSYYSTCLTSRFSMFFLYLQLRKMFVALHTLRCTLHTKDFEQF